MGAFWQSRMMQLLLLAALCSSALVVLCLLSTPVHAQDPDLVGWFCPQCGGLVPMGQRACPCGFSLDGRRDNDTPKPPNDGGRTDDGGNVRPRPIRPAVPQVSAEERRQREIYAREKQALLDLFKLPDARSSAPAVAVEDIRAPNDFTDPVLPVRSQEMTGLSDAEWERARACQAEIDALTRVWPVPAKDSARLDNLLAERNSLWDKATRAPGLTAEDRQRLRLRLFVVPQLGNAAAPLVTSATLQSLRSTPIPGSTPHTGDPVALALTRQLVIGSTVAMVEQAGKEHAGELLGEAAGARFGTVLGLAKVAIAAKKDAAEGLKAMADVLVGLIPIPQASFAVAGGRIYGNVAYRAMNDFMEKSMQVTGGSIDLPAFWKELDDELTINLRAYREWVHVGP
jgi:hypothetical protein